MGVFRARKYMAEMAPKDLDRMARPWKALSRVMPQTWDPTDSPASTGVPWGWALTTMVRQPSARKARGTVRNFRKTFPGTPPQNTLSRPIIRRVASPGAMPPQQRHTPRTRAQNKIFATGSIRRRREAYAYRSVPMKNQRSFLFFPTM